MRVNVVDRVPLFAPSGTGPRACRCHSLISGLREFRAPYLVLGPRSHRGHEMPGGLAHVREQSREVRDLHPQALSAAASCAFACSAVSSGVFATSAAASASSTAAAGRPGRSSRRCAATAGSPSVNASRRGRSGSDHDLESLLDPIRPSLPDCRLAPSRRPLV